MITANFEDEIPVLHDFCVDVCVRGVHYYKVQPDVGTIIDFAPETDPISLMHDRYAIAGKTSERKIGHVPKFMSRFVFYFLRHGGTVTGPCNWRTGILLRFGTRWASNSSEVFFRRTCQYCKSIENKCRAFTGRVHCRLSRIVDSIYYLLALPVCAIVFIFSWN